ncbi:hypothetical protein BU17DRAFT_63751 [Hysterangium stoloniferum]|nr:hypothetical protein BU17DRAFT_63751 [Hysterangium stoloniferum]
MSGTTCPGLECKSLFQHVEWRYSAPGILPCAWTRFDYYARRIRCLHYKDDGSSESKANIDVSVFVEIARARPKLILLPHLQHLAWYSIHFGYATLFMHSELSNLEVSIDGASMDAHAFKEAGAFLYELLDYDLCAGCCGGRGSPGLSTVCQFPERLSRIADYQLVWTAVENDLPFLVASRAAESDRSRALQRKLDTFKSRKQKRDNIPSIRW